MSDRPKVVDLPAPSDPLLRCRGAARDSENENSLVFTFDRRPTDEELRFLHDVMDRAAIMVRTRRDR